MKKNMLTWLQGILIFATMLVLVIGLTDHVQASGAMCIWQGDSHEYWDTSSRWSCGHVPGPTDMAVIPNAKTVNVTGVLSEDTIDVALIHVESGGVMNIYGGYTAQIYSNTWDNHGTINFYGNARIRRRGSHNPSEKFTNFETGVMNLRKFVDDEIAVIMFRSFENKGVVNLIGGNVGGYLNIQKGGSHSGTFNGDDKTLVTFGFEIGTENEEYILSLDSNYYAPELWVVGGKLTLSGRFEPQHSPKKILVFNGAEMIVAVGGTLDKASSIDIRGYFRWDYIMGTVEISELSINHVDAVFRNTRNLTINNRFRWIRGRLEGHGTTTVKRGAEFRILGWSHLVLHGHEIINDTLATWEDGDMTLASGAKITNTHMFRASATTTMLGGENGEFYNSSCALFNKITAGTTTTMDLIFNNHGSVNVSHGTLVLNDLFTNFGRVTVFHGTLDFESIIIPEDETLSGTGTLEGDVVNSGTVSPGDSAGVITILGNYTQVSTGVLEIELGGLDPVTEYDQLIVSSADRLAPSYNNHLLMDNAIEGHVTLDGRLNVHLIDEFEPGPGDRFDILLYQSVENVFDEINLPALPGELEWDVIYGESGLTLSVVDTAITYSLSVDVLPVSTGSVTMQPEGGVYPADTIVILKVNPEDGYVFNHWTGEDADDLVDNGDETWSITMNADKGLTANFVEDISETTNFIFLPLIRR